MNQRKGKGDERGDEAVKENDETTQKFFC